MIQRHSPAVSCARLSLALLVLFTMPVLGHAQTDKKKSTSTNTPPPKPATQVTKTTQTNQQPKGTGTTTNKQVTTTGNTSTYRTGTGNTTGKTGTANTGIKAGTTATAGKTTGGAGTTTGKGGSAGGSTAGKSGTVTSGGAGNVKTGMTKTATLAPRSGTVKTGPLGYKTTTMQIGGKPADVSRDARGTLRDIHHPDFDVHRGLRGDRRIERRFPGGNRVVLAGRGRGFYERPYVGSYYQRTYFIGGRRYAFAYRRYYWRNAYYYRYAPGFYYRPAFYGWAYRPWGAAVYYSWGWGPAPWYGYYGYYFAPAPFYPTASLWLTDYLLAENLRAAYEAQSQDGDPPAPSAQAANTNVVLTPEVKQAIAEEVQAQLQAEGQAASTPGGSAQPAGANDNDQAPSALNAEQRMFVVSSSLDVTDPNGNECPLSPGDILYRTDEPNGDSATVLVQASKRGDCSMNSKANVKIADLQEMQNQFRQSLDSGMQKLAAEQGKAGLPAAPDGSTTTVAGEVAPPAPDNADSRLQTAQTDADQAESQVSTQTQSGVDNANIRSGRNVPGR